MMEIHEHLSDVICGENIESRKRKIHLSVDDRLHRNRERNRMHARKTRERKKNQSNALQSRLKELQEEGAHLRQIVDERHTASVLLGLCQTFKDSTGENHTVLSSASICENAWCTAVNENSFLAEKVHEVGGGKKRTRRRGKHTQQEGERIRRERNRMHAKKTRDRKKELLEISENVIIKMEKESFLLREYLVSLRLLSVEEAHRLEARARESSKELAVLKGDGDRDDDEDEDMDEDEDENEEVENMDCGTMDSGDMDCGDPNEPEEDQEESLSGSDELDKEGSCDGSLEGETSSDGNASTSSKTSSSISSGSSGSGNDSTDVLTSTDTDICKKIHYKNRNNIIKPIENKSQSSESYNHSGLNMEYKEKLTVDNICIPFNKNECIPSKDESIKSRVNNRPVTSTFLSQSSLLPPNFNNNDFINDNNEKIDCNKRNNNYNINKDNNYNEKKIDFLVQKSTFKRSISNSNINLIKTPRSNLKLINPKVIPNKIPKISNIIIPLIPQGILHPRELGGVSPQGMKTPHTSSIQEESSEQKKMNMNDLRETKFLRLDNDVYENKYYCYNSHNGDIIYRHLPSSCPSHACEAL